MKIKFSAPIKPVTFKRPDSNGKRRFDTKEYAEFKTELGWIAKIAMHRQKPATGAVKLTVDVFRPIKPESLNFGDFDNHLKAVADALNGICYVDDRQIIEATVRLHRGGPRIIVELEELP